MEMQFTSGQFHADMFIMANNKAEGFAPSETATTLPITEYVVAQSVAGSNNMSKLVLSDVPAGADTINVRGFTATDAEGNDAPTSVAASKLVLYTYTDLNTSKTIAELYAQKDEVPVGTTVDVTYEKQYTAGVVKEMLVDNRSTAMGKVICKWPVYGSSDVCTDSAIRGYVIMTIFKARVTAAPGFDTSYKSAATNQITLSAMDAKREDGMVYSIAYIDNAEH